MVMNIAFLVIFVIANELTYNIALHEQLGICWHISSGWRCWLNRILMLIPCIWYCGWLWGIILFLFTLFGMLHATIGWVLTIPSLFAEEEKIKTIAELDVGALLPVNIICVIFVIVSFFLSEYKSVYFLLSDYVIILALVLVIGFLIRMVVAFIQKKCTS